MRYNETDAIFLDHLVSLGRRQNAFVAEGEPAWEAFARHVSGSETLLGYNGTEEEATACLRRTSRLLSRDGIRLLITKDDLINLLCVVRVYVDSQENEFVIVVEDVLGNNYLVEKGSESACINGAETLANVIYEASQER